jgi:hypothetical protein
MRSHAESAAAAVASMLPPIPSAAGDPSSSPFDGLLSGGATRFDESYVMLPLLLIVGSIALCIYFPVSIWEIVQHARDRRKAQQLY